MEAGKEHGQGSREGNRVYLVGKWEKELRQQWDIETSDTMMVVTTEGLILECDGEVEKLIELLRTLIIRLKHSEGGESAKTKQSFLKTELSFGPHLSQSW